MDPMARSDLEDVNGRLRDLSVNGRMLVLIQTLNLPSRPQNLKRRMNYGRNGSRVRNTMGY